MQGVLHASQCSAGLWLWQVAALHSLCACWMSAIYSRRGRVCSLAHSLHSTCPSCSPQHLVLAGVGSACKLFLTAGARTAIEGQERMAAALSREAGRGLITVSNHVGAVDDPLITSSSEYLLPGHLGVVNRPGACRLSRQAAAGVKRGMLPLCACCSPRPACCRAVPCLAAMRSACSTMSAARRGLNLACLLQMPNPHSSCARPALSAVVPADKLLEPRALRWTMCATDRCFKSQLLAPFFRAAKVGSLCGKAEGRAAHRVCLLDAVTVALLPACLHVQLSHGQLPRNARLSCAKTAHLPSACLLLSAPAGAAGGAWRWPEPVWHAAGAGGRGKRWSSAGWYRLCRAVQAGFQRVNRQAWLALC